VQAAATFGLQHDTFLPNSPPLVAFPLRLGDWMQVRDFTIEPEVLDVLGPDDSLQREYELPNDAKRASLFVAYYKTQLRAKNAHDPKVCLPGSGWNPTVSRVVNVPIVDSWKLFPANYYRIERGNESAVVIYWFQTPKGVYTFEQQLKLHRVLDSIIDNRTDMALVRVVVPIDESGVEAADTRALDLARKVYSNMLPYFPAKDELGS
jgi:EpsI family protein